MQIVVNTRLLLHDKLDGIGWFSYQTLKRITLNNPDVHFVFLFDRNYSDEFIFSENITPLVLGPQARHPFLYYAWFHYSVKNVLNRMKPDLFLSPDGFLALGAKCKQLPVIHDINFVHNPKDLKPLTRQYYNHYFPKYAKLGTRIATVSEYSKFDISENFKIDADKIDVVYNGINEGFKPLSVEDKKKTREKFSKSVPYFLFVGSQSPRKNLHRLIAAFDLFKEQSQSIFKLVLVGGVYSSLSELHKTIAGSKFKDDIIYLGRQPQVDLEKIMASAYALTFVPYFEGFGIPIIEAIQCEVPVICSNTTSMREVSSNAALHVNPYDTNSISRGMLDVYFNDHIRTQLIEHGKERKELFSWDKTADLLWGSITKCL